MGTDLNRAISDSVDLPTIPLVALKIMELVENERTTIEQLAATVSNDPALAAKILKLSNSAYYGCQKQIQTISAAIMLIGYSTLRSIVIAASMKQVCKQFGPLEKMLWEHSFGAALAARIIAGTGRHVHEETAFLAGLFHDIGKIILNNNDGATYQRLMERQDSEDLPLEELERGAYSCSHAEVGALVIARWNFPEPLSTAVLNHHHFAAIDFDDEYDMYLTAIASLADRYCQKLGIGKRISQPDLDLTASSEALALGMDSDCINDSLALFAETFEQTKSMFLG